MGFYDLSKEERTQLVANIQYEIRSAFLTETDASIMKYFSDEDTYIRKAAYMGAGRIYNSEVTLRDPILRKLEHLAKNKNELIRQTTVNAAGEIGMFQFGKVAIFFNVALFDKHHRVRNAVIGSVKKMSQKNHEPVLEWAKQFLTHPDKEVRREICHGIELRGRTHPQDVLPLLKELQHDKTKRVYNTLVHVIGQISYKKGCLFKVIEELNTWDNLSLVEDAVNEIIDVHSMERYGKFTALTQQQAIDHITNFLKV